jgi:hypothetical protein
VRTFGWELSLGNFRLETFAWELSFGNFRLETFAWELSLGNFRLEAFAWELSLGNFHLGILGPGSQAWGTGLRRLGEPAEENTGEPVGPAPLTRSLRY